MEASGGYSCQYCSNVFEKLHGLRRHQSVKHSQQEIGKRFRCRDCSRVYCSESAFKKHMKDYDHNGSNGNDSVVTQQQMTQNQQLTPTCVTCVRCGDAFDSNRMLRKHVERAHSQARETAERTKRSNDKNGYNGDNGDNGDNGGNGDDMDDESIYNDKQDKSHFDANKKNDDNEDGDSNHNNIDDNSEGNNSVVRNGGDLETSGAASLDEANSRGAEKTPRKRRIAEGGAGSIGSSRLDANDDATTDGNQQRRKAITTVNMDQKLSRTDPSTGHSVNETLSIDNQTRSNDEAQAVDNVLPGQESAVDVAARNVALAGDQEISETAGGARDVILVDSDNEDDPVPVQASSCLEIKKEVLPGTEDYLIDQYKTQRKKLIPNEADIRTRLRLLPLDKEQAELNVKILNSKKEELANDGDSSHVARIDAQLAEWTAKASALEKTEGKLKKELESLMLKKSQLELNIRMVRAFKLAREEENRVMEYDDNEFETL